MVLEIWISMVVDLVVLGLSMREVLVPTAFFYQTMNTYVSWVKKLFFTPRIVLLLGLFHDNLTDMIADYLLITFFL